MEEALNVISIEDNYAELKSIEEPVVDLLSPNNDIFFVKEKNKWLEFSQSDWEQVENGYRLIIPQSMHNYAEPYVDEMCIKIGDVWENNIPTYKITSNDSVVITSDDAINCKILIKGDL